MCNTTQKLSKIGQVHCNAIFTTWPFSEESSIDQNHFHKFKAVEMNNQIDFVVTLARYLTVRPARGVIVWISLIFTTNII